MDVVINKYFLTDLLKNKMPRLKRRSQYSWANSLGYLRQIRIDRVKKRF